MKTAAIVGRIHERSQPKPKFVKKFLHPRGHSPRTAGPTKTPSQATQKYSGQLQMEREELILTSLLLLNLARPKDSFRSYRLKLKVTAFTTQLSTLISGYQDYYTVPTMPVEPAPQRRVLSPRNYLSKPDMRSDSRRSSDKFSYSLPPRR
jgi:hypothetical protein